MEDYNTIMKNEFEPVKTQVLIIGAGASGLSAAYTLRHHGMGTIILEASNVLGGRVRKNTDFTNGHYPLSLGASYVQYPDAIKSIIGKDIEMAIPPGAHEPVFVNYTYFDFFTDYIAPKNADTIRYGCQVDSVDYQGYQVKTACQDGRSFLSNYVIVTVPLSILKDDDIDFSPPLPNSITTNHPGEMWKGFKVFIEFSQRFFDGVVCFGSCEEDPIGEKYFWESSAVQTYLANGRIVLEGYMMGDYARPFIGMKDHEIVDNLLRLMDQKFRNQASRFYVRHLVQNWSNDPFTRGTYASKGYDVAGAQNVQDKVFVAGEAFPIDGHTNGWVDSAVFSGDDAAKCILKLSWDITDDTPFYKLVRNNLSIEQSR